MLENSDLILYFRLVERAALAIIFIVISICLLVSYRKDTSVANLAAELDGAKIAIPLAKPFVAAVLLLGYVFVSLSHPVSVAVGAVEPEQSRQQILFFDRADVSRTFTNLAFREGGLTVAQVPQAQRLVRLALKLEDLRLEGHEIAISELLSNTELSIDGLEAVLDTLETQR